MWTQREDFEGHIVVELDELLVHGISVHLKLLIEGRRRMRWNGVEKLIFFFSLFWGDSDHERCDGGQ